MKLAKPFIIATAIWLAAAAASAQSAFLHGTVIDETGAALPGAVIVISTDDAANPQEAVTDRSGTFSAADVRRGTVRVHVEMPGFQTTDLKLTIATAEPPPIVVTLKVGFDEVVNVSAEAGGGVLAPSRNANAIEFDPEAIRRLPTDAQDLQALVDAFTFGAPGGASVVVDGVETDSAGVPASAIHRLTINRNPYAAEYRSPGKSRVEVETERGSRRYYHGSGAMFFRDSSLQARNAFAASTPDMTRALNEGTIGGLLPAKGWSFFASAQHLFDNDSAIVNARTVAGPLVMNVSTPERRTNALTRVDFRPNKADALTIRYDLFDDVERDHGVGGFRLADQAYTTTERRHRIQINDHRVFGGGTLHDIRAEVTSVRRVDGTAAAAPALRVEGAFVGGPSQTFTSDAARSLQLEDVATMTVAGRQLRIGARVKTRWTDIVDRSEFAGTFEFQSLVDFARGAPALFVQRSGTPSTSFATTDASVFADTSFRPTAALDITTGIRYDWQSRISDWSAVAPRLAVAFAPANRRTVVRGGAGLFVQTIPTDAIARATLFGDGGLREITIERPSFPAVPAGSASAPSASWELAPGLRLPRTAQTSVAIERFLWRKTSVTLEYLFLDTFDALRARDLNPPQPGSGVRLDRSRLNLFAIDSTGELRTHALTTTFRGRMAGFRGTLQYTWSRTLDDGSGPFDLPADSASPQGELARADFDRRHTFRAAGTYGWMSDRVRLGGVLSVATGAPFDILTGTDSNRDLVVNDRPFGVSRNAGDGPRLAQLDLRFTTVFRAPRPHSADPESAKREQTDNLELNLDLFNGFNRVNPTTYVGIVSSPLFGQANAARQARTAQLSLRYRF